MPGTDEGSVVASVTGALRAAGWTGHASIALELAYLDPRDRAHGDRERHFADALRVSDELARLNQTAPALVAFYNDLGPESETLCGVSRCDPGAVTSSEDDEAGARTALVLGREVRAFRMRSTRNRATKAVKRAVKRGLVDGLGVRVSESGGDLATDLIAETTGGPVYLGSREAGTSRIIPRCTLIMAQHYFDAFRAVRGAGARGGEFVFIDFNRAIERDRVGRGAEASFVVNEWPGAVRAIIVNVIYYPDAERVGVQTTVGPGA